MADIQTIMNKMEVLLEEAGYTVYDVTEWEKKKVSQRPEAEFPMIFIGRGVEEIDNTGNSGLFILLNTTEVDLSVVLSTGQNGLYVDAALELRKIKNVIYNNQCISDFWSNWTMDDNQVVQLATSNSQSEIYGGIKINTTVLYREENIVPTNNILSFGVGVSSFDDTVTV